LLIFIEFWDVVWIRDPEKIFPGRKKTTGFQNTEKDTGIYKSHLRSKLNAQLVILAVVTIKKLNLPSILVKYCTLYVKRLVRWWRTAKTSGSEYDLVRKRNRTAANDCADIFYKCSEKMFACHWLINDFHKCKNRWMD
jgi:hypothetical protein